MKLQYCAHKMQKKAGVDYTHEASRLKLPNDPNSQQDAAVCDLGDALSKSADDSTCPQDISPLLCPDLKTLGILVVVSEAFQFLHRRRTTSVGQIGLRSGVE